MRQTESLHHRKIFCKWSPGINRIDCATEAAIVTIIDTVCESGCMIGHQNIMLQLPVTRVFQIILHRRCSLFRPSHPCVKFR